jgi:hypothetical protein
VVGAGGLLGVDQVVLGRPVFLVPPVTLAFHPFPAQPGQRLPAPQRQRFGQQCRPVRGVPGGTGLVTQGTEAEQIYPHRVVHDQRALPAGQV